MIVKSELKTGMCVKTLDGYLYYVIIDSLLYGLSTKRESCMVDFAFYRGYGERTLFDSKPLDSFSDDLVNTVRIPDTIIAVYDHSISDMLNDYVNGGVALHDRQRLYKRELSPELSESIWTYCFEEAKRIYPETIITKIKNMMGIDIVRNYTQQRYNELVSNIDRR